MFFFPRRRGFKQHRAHDGGRKQAGQQEEQFYSGYPGLLLLGGEGGIFRSLQSTAAHQYQRQYMNQLAVI